jgi:hypothetical protein
LLAAVCAATASFALPAASQAALVSSSACTVPAGTQQFAGDSHSYYDAGGVAVSPGSPQDIQACVNIAHPTVRVNVASLDSGATLSLSAVFDVGSTTVAIPLGTVSDTGLSQAMRINVVNRAALKAIGTASVTLRISSEGGGATVSDTWVDPWGG